MNRDATTLLVVDDDDVSVIAVQRAAASLGLEMQTLRARDDRRPHLSELPQRRRLRRPLALRGAARHQHAAHDRAGIPRRAARR